MVGDDNIPDEQGNLTPREQAELADMKNPGSWRIGAFNILPDLGII
jgi:hypothetical protein